MIPPPLVLSDTLITDNSAQLATDYSSTCRHPCHPHRLKEPLSKLCWRGSSCLLCRYLHEPTPKGFAFKVFRPSHFPVGLPLQQTFMELTEAEAGNDSWSLTQGLCVPLGTDLGFPTDVPYKVLGAACLPASTTVNSFLIIASRLHSARTQVWITCLLFLFIPACFASFDEVLFAVLLESGLTTLRTTL